MKRKSKAISQEEKLASTERTARNNVENSNTSFKERNADVNNRISSILGMLKRQTAVRPSAEENGAYSPNLPKAPRPTFDGEDETRQAKLKRQWEEFGL